MVIMATENEIHVCCIEHLPYSQYPGIALTVRGAEQRPVAIIHRAQSLVGGDVLLEPLLLFSYLLSRAFCSELAVQNDHMPLANIITVVPLEGGSGPGAEILVIGHTAARLVIMIADRRTHCAHD